MAVQGVPQALRELDLDSLVGMPSDDARRRVEAAEGEAWLVEPDAYIDSSLRPRRVVLGVAGNIVVSASADFAEVEKIRPTYPDR